MMSGCNFTISEKEIKTAYQLCEKYQGLSGISKNNVPCVDVNCLDGHFMRFCKVEQQ